MVKRRRTDEDLDLELGDFSDVLGLQKKKKTTKKKKRAPTLKSKLLAKLRARKKVLSTELRGVKRDIKSLSPRRIKKD